MGQRTEERGHVVEVGSAASAVRWEEALARILKTLCQKGTCNLIATDSFSCTLVTEMLAAEESMGTAADLLYLRSPMNNICNVQKRGFLIQAMGQQIDQMLNPLSSVSSFGKTGVAVADWVRDEKRIELKSARLSFHRSGRRFSCFFVDVKPALFDELWLALCSPLGIYFYRAKSLWQLELSVGTDHGGLVKAIYGPRNETDPLKALEVIRRKMSLKGCELIAVVHWDQQGSYEGHALNLAAQASENNRLGKFSASLLAAHLTGRLAFGSRCRWRHRVYRAGGDFVHVCPSLSGFAVCCRISTNRSSASSALERKVLVVEFTYGALQPRSSPGLVPHMRICAWLKPFHCMFSTPAGFETALVTRRLFSCSSLPREG